MAIQGLNAEALAWQDFTPKPDAQRVLLVNDLAGVQGLSLDVLAAGDVPLFADLSGFKMRLAAPSALNLRTWDIRDPDTMLMGLRQLGVSKLVLRSLIGATDAVPPIDVFRSFQRMQADIEVEVDPTEPEKMLPWLYDGVPKIFGAVDITAWRDAYEDLTGVAKEAAQ